MNRLGYSRYVAQGGDQGASVTDAMGRHAPDGLLGIHLNLLTAFPTDVGAALFGGLIPAGLFKRVAIAVLAHRAHKKEPETLDAVAALFEGLLRRDARASADDRLGTRGYAARAGRLDARSRPDSYTKISRAFLDGNPSGGLTRDKIVDNITLYWLTNTATSSARLYGSNSESSSVRSPPGRSRPSSRPVAFTVFPARSSRRRAAGPKVYPNLIYFNEAERGGHFAAWESPRSSPRNSVTRSGRCATSST